MTPQEKAKLQRVTDKLTGDVHRVWLEACAKEHEISFDQLMDGARRWIDNEDYTCIGVDTNYAAMVNNFWNHYEAYTLEKVEEAKRTNFFSCSC